MPDLESAKQVKELEEKLREASAEVAACLEFLSTELGWEYFRAEFLYHDDAEKKAQSLENARLLTNYLAETGHGIKFLQVHAALKGRNGCDAG